MSKNTGMGRKRMGQKANKGMDRCDAGAHGKQCGRPKEVSKGNQRWMSPEPEIKPFHPEIHIPNQDNK